MPNSRKGSKKHRGAWLEPEVIERLRDVATEFDTKFSGLLEKIGKGEVRVESASETRNGKHKKGKVRIGVYIEPRCKAIAILTARTCGMTMTDVICAGIESIAKSRGIIESNGAVSVEYADRFVDTFKFIKQSRVNG